jgi:hypothetical protein
VFEEAVPDLYQLAFMPGCFRCKVCGFVLSKVCINPDLEVIGTREEDRESEPCPNDGTPLTHITYREQLEVYAERLKEEFARYEILKTAASALIEGMETCHLCKCTVLIDGDPTHCENCSCDCEDHDAPDCIGLHTLHTRLKKVLAL